MNRLTNWFLKQNSQKVFFLSFMIIPFYGWLFSIIYQMDKKRKKKTSPLKTLVSSLMLIYIAIHVFLFISLNFRILQVDLSFYSHWLVPFHIIALFFGLLMVIMATNSFVRYEEEKQNKTFESVELFFLFAFYVYGIWQIQAKLYEYSQK